MGREGGREEEEGGEENENVNPAHIPLPQDCPPSFLANQQLATQRYSVGLAVKAGLEHSAFLSVVYFASWTVF